MYTSLMMFGTWLKLQTSRFLRDEEGAVNVIEIVVILAIVIALAIMFRKEIANLFSAIFPNKESISNELNQEMEMGGGK